MSVWRVGVAILAGALLVSACGGAQAAHEGTSATPEVVQADPVISLAAPTAPAMPQTPTCGSPASAAGSNGLCSPRLPETSAAPSPPANTPQPDTPLPPPEATPCAQEICAYPDVFIFNRPIAPPGRDTIDTSYRFGTTENKQRDPHHGVEFLNSKGTPVHAAADGVVVVAGDDREIFYGPYSYFYGNLVVLRHQLPPSIPGSSQPVFTLYAHLSEVLVSPGQAVKAGQEIGKVGMTGVATGSHLHFEVRWGENAYSASRNPEIWLKPHANEQGVQNGSLAGRILDSQGRLLEVSNIVIEPLGQDGQPDGLKYYLETYEEKDLLGEPPWGESFALGDLPPGMYRISFIKGAIQQRQVEVLPGTLSVMTIQLQP